MTKAFEEGLEEAMRQFRVRFRRPSPVTRMDRATKLERLKQVRESALRVLKERGEWQTDSGQRHLVAQVDDIVLLHTTPFQAWPDRDRPWLTGNGSPPYGLEVWVGGKGKVLNLHWDAEGAIQLVAFKPGDWELTLARSIDPSTSA